MEGSWGLSDSKLEDLGSELGFVGSKLWLKLALKLHFVNIAAYVTKIDDFHIFCSIYWDHRKPI